MTLQADVITVELVDGTKVIVPDSLENITSYVLREQGDWFEDEIRFLRDLMQPGETVVDIGANYGVYSLSLARIIGPSGQLWAFEPASATAALLKTSAVANGTSWLHVVQQALSDREGTAWLQTPGHAELNSLASSDSETDHASPGEEVTTTTLDHCLDSFGWTAVDLLKIDAEGAEEHIIRGGTRFFRQLSPLVMFEVKAGNELQLDLVECFAALGYQCFRLIPGLNALAPFSAQQGVDGYLLNLFAAKPDRAAALAETGWLVMDENPAPVPTDVLASCGWVQALQDLPYARNLASKWQDFALSKEEAVIKQALAAWTLSQDTDTPMAVRYALLTQSYRLLQQQCKLPRSRVHWASLARVSLALGERVQAVQAMSELLDELQSGIRFDFEEPFLCPSAAFESIEVKGHKEAWIEAATLVAMEHSGSFSGFYTGEHARTRLERIFHLGYPLESIQRRADLVNIRFSQIGREVDSNQSVRDWFNFLGLEKPIRCIDVGAMGLGGDPEPWVLWSQQGCAEVLGFEPLQEECEKLNQQAQNSGVAIQYLPWALGDGLPHTLYVTNAPMTSSLFPPARSTVDLFPSLGELMQVEKTVNVHTRRLDDIEAAADADFLKLDVQGAELMILQNAQHCLQSVSVIQCEVEFVELYEGQPLMADVDTFLRSQGFCFLRFAYTMGRPFKPLQKADKPYTAISQMLWADAIYVRDFRLLRSWSDRQLRAAAFLLHEAYNAFDFTLLILRALDQRGGGDLAGHYATALMLTQNGEMIVHS